MPDKIMLEVYFYAHERGKVIAARAVRVRRTSRGEQSSLFDFMFIVRVWLFSIFIRVKTSEEIIIGTAIDFLELNENTDTDI